jgi:hypothetical protein
MTLNKPFCEQAASILRKVIENVELPDDKYHSSEFVSLENSVQKIPKLLTSWPGGSMS